MCLCTSPTGSQNGTRSRQKKKQNTILGKVKNDEKYVLNRLDIHFWKPNMWPSTTSTTSQSVCRETFTCACVHRYTYLPFAAISLTNMVQKRLSMLMFIDSRWGKSADTGSGMGGRRKDHWRCYYMILYVSILFLLCLTLWNQKSLNWIETFHGSMTVVRCIYCICCVLVVREPRDSQGMHRSICSNIFWRSKDSSECLIPPYHMALWVLCSRFSRSDRILQTQTT